MMDPVGTGADVSDEGPLAEIGVIHGRFQVLHNDHMRYILAGKSRCRHLVVGIANPDPTLTRDDPADPHRSHASANPLTYFERYVLVREALSAEGLSLSDFSIVPFPVNAPELYGHYVPLNGLFFLTIYDEWGRKKLQYFQSLGLRTKVLWTRPPERKGISGSEVRRRMAFGETWEHLVPPSVRVLLEKWEVPQRLRRVMHA